MPAGDRRGPNGMGSMTGRGLGFCSGNDRPGYADGGYGMGQGRGFRGGGGGRSGGGRGYRNRYYAPDPYIGQREYPYPAQGYAPYSEETEKGALKDQVSFYEKAIGDIKSRLADLEKGADA